ncbi:MAG: L-serine ammonia-lyase, iron-sulfur-dependent, subunit alpha [Bacteroidales bacterium]|jgi:L-serine dehydratase|nr:L-serine ammonia-lyase, iron-sulfur-dependent, subunit alpha [Bacteroidales bacterium]
MESITKIYKIGHGPSSSHTMGPSRAAKFFKAKHPDAAKFRVTLFGSLCLTGKGHLTDIAIYGILGKDRTEILWNPEFRERHPNALLFEALSNENQIIGTWMVYSIGGGEIVDDSMQLEEKKDLYPHTKMKDILNWCHTTGHTYWEYVEMYEEHGFWDYLAEVWDVMKASVERGIEHDGVLPGVLGLRRKATSYYAKALSYKDSLRGRCLTYTYALAVAEENASCGKVVTAPTCGSAGVLPAILYHSYKTHGHTEKTILKALATGGLIGNLVKENASISGAEVGCQGEIGTACAMASGAAGQIFGGSIFQIEYAAEMGLEHHLGSTCDPMCGLVQIPCIERCAFAAARAFDSNMYALMSDGQHRVSFDKVVEVMKQTGHDLPSLYKETSEGGLATISD